MVTFGVEGSPARQTLAHLSDALELSLRRSPCGYLGDAMLFTMALFERQVDNVVTTRLPADVMPSFVRGADRVWFEGDLEEGGRGRCGQGRGISRLLRLGCCFRRLIRAGLGL